MSRLYNILNDIVAKVLASKDKTDKMTLNADLQVDVNASGNPYLRWTKGGTQYQFVLGPSTMAYQKNTGSGWTTLWTK